MKPSRLILVTLLSVTQINGLPTSGDSNVAVGVPDPSVTEEIPDTGGYMGKVKTWFGLGDEDQRVVDILGKMECDSDKNWRKSGWCAVAGRAFPKDGGVAPNAMEPILMPGIPNHLVGWDAPKTNPEELYPFKPPPPPACPPIKGYGPGRHENPIPDGNPWDVPYAPWTGGFDTVLRDGSVFHTPVGYPQGWTSNQRIEIYKKLCVTEAPWEAPLLDENGHELCDMIEGDLYDAKDDLAEALELAEQYDDLEEETEQDDDSHPPRPSMPAIDGWQDHPEFGKQDPFKPAEDPYLMSGGLGPGEVPIPKSVEQGARWKRNFRRVDRKIRQFKRRGNYNGFYDETNAEGINELLGVRMDPLLNGPGPEDDPAEERWTEVEKLEAAIETIQDLPYVPMVLPPGYSWVPAEKAEFGDDWERAKRWAQLMGREPLRKAEETPNDIYKMQSKAPQGVPSPFIPKLLSLYGFHGAMITPEVFAQLRWRTKRWAKLKPKKNATHWWVKKYLLKPVYKNIKRIIKPKWKKKRRQQAIVGAIAAMWGIILGVHFKHEKHMEDLGKPFQKFTASMQKGYGPWVQTESTFTTTIDGTAMISTVTGLSQYDPASETLASPNELLELLGVTLTTTLSTAETITTGSNGMATTITATLAEIMTIGSDGMTTTVTATPATITAPAAAPAIEYAGMYRLPPETYYYPVTTTASGAQGPPLQYVQLDRLIQFGLPVNLSSDHSDIEEEDRQPAPRPASPLQSEDFAAVLNVIMATPEPTPTPNLTPDSSPSFTLLPSPRLLPDVHGPYVMNGPFRNGTFINGTRLELSGAVLPSDTPLSLPKGAVVNATESAVTSPLNSTTSTSSPNKPINNSSASSSSSSSSPSSPFYGTHAPFANGTTAAASVFHVANIALPQLQQQQQQQQRQHHHSSNFTHSYTNGTSTDAAEETPATGPELPYLRGTASWRGRVTPEARDMIPATGGLWRCEWRPERVQ